MSKEMIWATGRRKCASASIRLCDGTGNVMVNGQTAAEYFPTETVAGYVYQPLKKTAMDGKVDIFVTVKGGGPMGQAGAIRHGISRALIKYEESLRPSLKAAGMLTRDARVKERKKSGQPGARKRFQFSKR